MKEFNWFNERIGMKVIASGIDSPVLIEDHAAAALLHASQSSDGRTFDDAPGAEAANTTILPLTEEGAKKDVEEIKEEHKETTTAQHNSSTLLQEGEKSSDIPPTE